MRRWDGESAPPRRYVVVHRVLGPPVAAAVSLCDALLEARGVFASSYTALRSHHADRWPPGQVLNSKGDDRA